jgi:micrococcal nuclease
VLIGEAQERDMKDHRLAVGRVLLLAALLALLPAPVASQGDSVLVRVVRVIDGDTIQVCCLLEDLQRVRYIGINTPETKHPTKGVEHFGKEASEANRKLVSGKIVELEFDVQQWDKYGRVLGYIYLQDGTFVNAWLVEHGFAQVMTVPPNVKHQDLFLTLQREVREAGRGLWRKGNE